MTRRQGRISLEGLRVLDAIERHGSFAAAAQALFVVTSSVTHAVRGLEESLGLTLFDRSGRRARLTREGRMLLERGRVLLAQAAAFDAESRVIATGWEPRLAIAVDQVMRMEPLMPLVRGFCEAAPETSLELRREAAAGSWDALLGGRADLVLGAPAEGPPGGGYESRLLYRIRFVMVASPRHPLARMEKVLDDADLAAHRSVILGDTTRRLPHLPVGLRATWNHVAVPDTAAKLQAILLGVGCGFLPERLARPYVKGGKLAVLRVATPAPPSESRLAWRAGENGRALKWWIAALTRPRFAPRLFF